MSSICDAPGGATDPARAHSNEWRMHGRRTKYNYDLKNPIAQLGIMRQFSRVWCAYLTVPERDLLRHILDQTICWGKHEARFTHRQLSEGNGYNSGTGRGRAQTSALIASLEAKGFIFVDRTDLWRGLNIMPNIDWEPEATTQRPTRKGKTQTEAAPPPPRKRERPAPIQAPVGSIADQIKADREQLVEEGKLQDARLLEQTMRRAFDRLHGKTSGPRWTPWPEEWRTAIGSVLICWPTRSAVERDQFAEWIVRVWGDLRAGISDLPEVPHIVWIDQNVTWLFDKYKKCKGGPFH